MEKQTYYKKDSKGKIRQWSIWTDGGDLLQEAGLVDGKLVPHTKTCKIKNKGKSNETTPENQAIAEMGSSILSKRDEGYFPTIKEAEEEEVILPMLAKSYDDHAKKIDWENDDVYIQPKLDGMRCLKNPNKMISRENKIIDTVPHIMEDITHIADYLDGELYAHGLSFQENMKLVKKAQPESINIKYHVYDMVLPNLSFSERYTLLETLVQNVSHTELVPTFKVESEEEVKKYHAQFLSEGYEGSIIRWGDAPYKVNGRSANLLKYKDFHDIVCRIVDIEPAEQRPEWGVPVLEHNGETFRAGMKYSHEEREDFLTNKKKYIGKPAEIRFFEYTDAGIPRFPVMVGIRLDK